MDEQGEGEASDLELLQRFGDPDPARRREAFSVLFERHQKRAFDLAYRVLRDAALAADVVQESFITVYSKGAKFEARARFTSWLHRVVLNRAIDMQRRERRHRMLPLAASAGRDGDLDREAAVPEPSGDLAQDPVQRMLASERVAMVQAAIERLSPKLAEVVLLRYPQGLSYEEIGELLDAPPGTVKSRLNRAHAALRSILEEDLGPPAETDS